MKTAVVAAAVLASTALDLHPNRVGHGVPGCGLAESPLLAERIRHDQALPICRSADIVFDQCLIGFHGYFAIEAMAMGKPVITYIRKPDKYLLDPDECPIISAPPDRVESVLRELASDRRRLYELAVRGRRYVENHFTVKAFAKRLGQAYHDLGLDGS